METVAFIDQTDKGTVKVTLRNKGEAWEHWVLEHPDGEQTFGSGVAAIEAAEEIIANSYAADDGIDQSVIDEREASEWLKSIGWVEALPGKWVGPEGVISVGPFESVFIGFTDLMARPTKALTLVALVKILKERMG